MKRISLVENIDSLNMLPLRTYALSRFVSHIAPGNVHRCSLLNRSPTALRWQHTRMQEVPLNERPTANQTNRKSPHPFNATIALRTYARF